MPYLRWSNGDWYVYRVKEGKPNHKHEERVAVWHTDWPKPRIITFLTANSCMRGYWDAFGDLALSDIEEMLLMDAFRTFIEDVEKDWKTGKFKPV